MSKLTQNWVNGYKEKREWRKTHHPWLWRAENSIIFLITYFEKLIVSVVVVFLFFLLMGFIIACFESFNFQNLIGIFGVVSWAIIAIPKTRHSMILRTDPAKSIDRIIVTFSIGFILISVGSTGLIRVGREIERQTIEEKERISQQKREQEALVKQNYVDQYKTNRTQILKSFEENISEKKYMFVISETEKYLSIYPNDEQLKKLNSTARWGQGEINFVNSGGYQKAKEKERAEKAEIDRLDGECQQECSVNKYEYSKSCYKACMETELGR